MKIDTDSGKMQRVTQTLHKTLTQSTWELQTSRLFKHLSKRSVHGSCSHRSILAHRQCSGAMNPSPPPELHNPAQLSQMSASCAILGHPEALWPAAISD